MEQLVNTTEHMLIPVDVLDSIKNRDMARELRNQRSFLNILTEILALSPSEKALIEYVNCELAIKAIEKELDPTFFGYTENLEGEMDDLSSITHLSVVHDDGTVEGPLTGTLANPWLMTEAHVRARETRWENGEPEDWSRMKLTCSRMLHDDNADSQANSDFSMFDSRKAEHNLAVYKRDGAFHLNIRIMTQSNGTPLSVLPDWKPEEEYEEFDMPIRVSSDHITCTFTKRFEKISGLRMRQFKREEDKIVIDKVHDYYVRLRNAKCGLIKYLWENTDVKNLPSQVRSGFRMCAINLNEANMFYFSSFMKKKIHLLDDNGQRVYNEDGKPVFVYRKAKKLIKGGIPFKKSGQLAPTPGQAYSKIPRFSVVGVNAQNLHSRFTQMNLLGKLDVCSHVEYKGDKRIVKKQAYAVLPYRLQGTLRHFVVFSDLQQFRP